MGPTELTNSQVPAEFLAMIGEGTTAYIKRVEVDGTTAWAIHGADGSELAVMGDREVAFAAARQHDLEPFSVN
ncbi:MAG: DUF1150 family protein [Alphaproteobacteria bacterium]|jgi:hypothetical protein|nr:DUF1150 family protein [Alphaproteobacteria bacterium]MBT4711586.1 DUF1150 family protein [Alphaproteobacteria bacterium]MBT5860159.1 DUF1150 family protein [Alphaproteobacteria bacterium]